MGLRPRAGLRPGIPATGDGTGAARSFPQEWERLCAILPPEERADLVAAYGRRLADSDPAVRVPVARAWTAWELSANTLLPAPVPDLDDRLVVAVARIGQQYVSRGCFLGEKGLLAELDRIRHIPGVIVNGRYDLKTTVDGAFELHRAWPEAEFHVTEDAGHGAAEPGTCDRLTGPAAR